MVGNAVSAPSASSLGPGRFPGRNCCGKDLQIGKNAHDDERRRTTSAIGKEFVEVYVFGELLRRTFGLNAEVVKPQQELQASISLLECIASLFLDISMLMLCTVFAEHGFALGW
jgi:hypothetical protein